MSAIMNDNCPVCGYDKLELPPRDYSICACCGTEFGASDRILTHEQLRDSWINAGYPWFDEDEPPHENWDPVDQLTRAGLVRANTFVDPLLIKHIGEPVSLTVLITDATANESDLIRVA
jgi:hypothetical protein